MANPSPNARVQKHLASLGLGSRRQLDGWIQQGRVTIDGKLAVVGARVTPNCRITIDGRLITAPPPRAAIPRLLLYHKPVGEICSHRDPRGRPNVFAALPALVGARWVVVGRLDVNSSGLLFFTNDGDLANQLMHPRHAIEREYHCRVFGTLTRTTLTQLEQGITVDGERLCFTRVAHVADPRTAARNSWYRVALQQGRYREVRRLWQAVGCQVSRLHRVRYGKVALPRQLTSGSWLELDAELIMHLTHNDPATEVVTPTVRSRRLARTGAKNTNNMHNMNNVVKKSNSSKSSVKNSKNRVKNPVKNRAIRKNEKK